MSINHLAAQLPDSPAKRRKPKRVISRNHFIRIGRLTPRQDEVMKHIAKGMTQGDVAELLKVRPAVINHHMLNIRITYGAKTTAEAVAMWAGEQSAKSNGNPPESKV